MHTTEGFIKLPRSLLEWCWYEDANVFRLYVHLFFKAAFKDGEWKTEKIKKGQLITSRKKLAEQLKISESMVTRILKKLESTGDISLKSNSQYTVITLLKWAEFQESRYFFCPDANSNRTASEQQMNNNRTHINNVNNINKENNVNKYGARARERENLSKIATYDLSLVDKIINESF